LASLEQKRQAYDLAINIMQADAIRAFELHRQGQHVSELLGDFCDAEYELEGDCEIFGTVVDEWGVDAPTKIGRELEGSDAALERR